MASLGFEGTELQSPGFLEAIHPADRSTYQTLWTRVNDGQEDEFFAEYRFKGKKGHYRWVQTFGVVLDRQPDGRMAHFFGLDRDISLKRQSEALLQNRFLELERRYLMSESLRVAGSVVTASLELESTIPRILEQAETLFPFTGARVWASVDSTLELLGQKDAPDTMELFAPSTGTLVSQVLRDKAPLIIDNLEARLGMRGTAYRASWLGIPLVFRGSVRGVMEFWHEETGFFRSEYVWPALAFGDNVAIGLFNARQFRATQEASETDVLTGLGTRRRLERVGPKLFEHAVEKEEDLAIFMVDLDYFKAINDTYGHAQGDNVLQHFSRTCLAVLRKDDVVCRYGGDEFVVLLPTTNEEQAHQVALRLSQLFKNRDFPFVERRPSLSLGISTLRKGDHPNLSELLKAADTALYRAKEQGRDRIEIHRP